MSESATPTRRHVVIATALGTVTTGALVACGGDDDAGTGTSATTPAATGGSSGGTGAITQVADVPVGGAVSAKAPDGTDLVIAQPTAGEVVAFDARCPHQGCAVAPDGEQYVCPCHNSTFEFDTGEVTNGPATSGLTKFTVTVADGAVVAG